MKYVGNYVERSESKGDGDLTINVGLVDEEEEYFKVNVYINQKNIRRLLSLVDKTV